MDPVNIPGGAVSLDSFLQAYKTWETKRFLFFQWFDHLDKMRKTELLHMVLLTVNFAAVVFLKQNKMSTLIFWKVERPEKKLLSHWNCRSYPPLRLNIINTYNEFGSSNKWSHSVTFCADVTIMMFLQLWKYCKRSLPLTTIEISISWSWFVFYQTWPSFVYMKIHMRNSIPSRSVMRTFCRKLEKVFLTHFRYSHEKQLLMKLSFENNKQLQIIPWDWSQPILPLLDDWTPADRSSYALVSQIREVCIHSLTKQDP